MALTGRFWQARPGSETMPEFVIEKEIAGLGQLSDFAQDQAVRRSCSTLHGVTPGI
jgi:hypothetical protein